MAESSIVTGQFVRIEQTPASIGERILAFIIDIVLLAVYVFVSVLFIDKTGLSAFSSHGLLFLLFIIFIYLPVVFYFFLCEVFNQGQSLGKRLMHIRVVKKDGSTPSIGSYLLRWLLLLVDLPLTGGAGVLVVLFTRNNQRIGDLAAGTLVIKEKNYRKIHVSLDEFDYLTDDYRPTYPQAADLSLEQVDVITRTLRPAYNGRARCIQLLSEKIRRLFSIVPKENDEKFLQTVLRDYRYYALDDV